MSVYRLRLLMLLTVTSTSSALSVTVPPPPIVALEISGSQPRAVPRADVVQLTSSAVRCGAAEIIPTVTVLPFNTTRLTYIASPPPPLHPPQPPVAQTLDFAIGADGRPRSIRLRPAEAQAGFYVDTSDLAPALAGWRFAAGQPHGACSITFLPTITPIAAAPVTTLARLLAGPTVGDAGAAAFKRLQPPGSDCYQGRHPNARTLNFPPFDRIAQAPGTWTYAYLSHDIDAAGRAIRVQLIASSGNAEFDRASAAALGRDRFQPGVRHGCLFEFHQRPDPMPEPTRPTTPVAVKGPDCPGDLQQILKLPPGRPFPPMFRRRAIGGYAVLRFDIASWGATGNVSVVEAEPAEAFGQAARGMIERAHAAPSANGYRGCVTTVHFRLPEQERDARSDGWILPE